MKNITDTYQWNSLRFIRGNVFIWGFLTIVIITLMSCNNNKSQVETPEAAEEQGSHTETPMTRELVMNAGITFGQIVTRELSDDVSARGKLVLPPENLANVSSQIEGIVTKINVKIGDYVNRGAILCYISHPRLIELQHNYMISKTRYELEQENNKRQKELYEENVNSLKKLQEAQTAYYEAQSNYESSKAALELLRISPKNIEEGIIIKELPIYSPISGHVDEIHTYLGTFISPSDNLFNIVNNNNLNIELSVFEKDIIKVKKGQRVTFIIPNIGSQQYETEVTSISRSVKEDSRVVRVTAAFENKEADLFPGMFVAGTIHTSEKMVQALPEESIIIEGDNEFYVFYTLSDENDDPILFKRLVVKTGFVEDGFVQVTPLEKIAESARIVTNGGYYVKAEMLKGQE